MGRATPRSGSGFTKGWLGMQSAYQKNDCGQTRERTVIKQRQYHQFTKPTASHDKCMQEQPLDNQNPFRDGLTCSLRHPQICRHAIRTIAETGREMNHRFRQLTTSAQEERLPCILLPKIEFP